MKIVEMSYNFNKDKKLNVLLPWKNYKQDMLLWKQKKAEIEKIENVLLNT